MAHPDAVRAKSFTQKGRFGMSTTQAMAFIAALRRKKSLRLELASLDEGDWAGIVKVAKAAGFTFTSQEIQAAVPEGFYKDAGADPEQGWSRETAKK